MPVDPVHLQAILDKPLDDAPRLAAAEVLLRAGDPRGELVMVQCRLTSRGLDGAKRATLRRRERELLAAHESEWKGAAIGLPNVRLRRGFVDEVQGSVSELAPNAARLFATEPVTRLTLTSARAETLAPLAEAGAFSRVLQLTVRGPIGDEGARVLSEALAKRQVPLVSLNVGGNELGSTGAQALGSVLEGCQKLTLTSNSLGDEGAIALAKEKKLGKLRALYLTNNELSDEALVALAKSSCLTGLARLGVAGNDDVSREGLRAVAKSKKLQALQWLEYTDQDAFCQRIAIRTAPKKK
jgi:uncharacterized protein (TIGR02996 family)